MRLGYAGVPPLAPELFDYLEGQGAGWSSTKCSGSSPCPRPAASLVDRYLDYTYPYSVFERIADIEREIARREIEGLVHYVQSFCFRQVEDILLRRRLEVPLLTVEMDGPTRLDARTRMRLENFVNMLSERRPR